MAYIRMSCMFNVWAWSSLAIKKIIFSFDFASKIVLADIAIKLSTLPPVQFANNFLVSYWVFFIDSSFLSYGGIIRKYDRILEQTGRPTRYYYFEIFIIVSSGCWWISYHTRKNKQNFTVYTCFIISHLWPSTKYTYTIESNGSGTDLGTSEHQFSFTFLVDTYPEARNQPKRLVQWMVSARSLRCLICAIIYLTDCYRNPVSRSVRNTEALYYRNL